MLSVVCFSACTKTTLLFGLFLSSDVSGETFTFTSGWTIDCDSGHKYTHTQVQGKNNNNNNEIGKFSLSQWTCSLSNEYRSRLYRSLCAMCTTTIASKKSTADAQKWLSRSTKKRKSTKTQSNWNERQFCNMLNRALAVWMFEWLNVIWLVLCCDFRRTGIGFCFSFARLCLNRLIRNHSWVACRERSTHSLDFLQVWAHRKRIQSRIFGYIYRLSLCIATQRNTAQRNASKQNKIFGLLKRLTVMIMQHIRLDMPNLLAQ